MVSFVADSLSRPLRDLRISVTDRCNMRCTYCMPREVFGKDFVFLRRSELLSFEEITRLARLFVEVGVRKIRISGGEPLLRHGVERLIEKLAVLRPGDGGNIEIAMTTNGSLLAKKARSLKDAGLQRVSVSLDALSQEGFRRMGDSGVAVNDVLDGISMAQAVGLQPVKVNTVVRRHGNEEELLPLLRHFRGTGIIVRFIEYMDVGSTNGWRLNEVVTAREILARIEEEFSLRSLDPNYAGEVAQRWAFADGSGEIGIIASVTQPFCDGCSRARLATDGKLYTCLFGSEGLDLRGPMRSSESDLELRGRIVKHWMNRSDRYSQLRHVPTAMSGKRIEMSYIGG